MSDRSYRSIVKGTAIFGGVQVFNILINLLRGKFIALFLGTAGMGVSALLTSTMNIIVQVSGLGLNLSAVKEIAQTQETNDTERRDRIMRIFRRLLIGTATVGTVVTICLARPLSILAFGNASYTWAFMLLSLMLFFTVLSNGETAILQGNRRLKILAKSTLLGAAVGLAAGTPLYYFLGTMGIAPAMVILAVSTFLIQRNYTRKIIVEQHPINIRETLKGGRNMIELGIVQMTAALIGATVIYIVNTYISHFGRIEDVGLFQAASSISNQYIGLIFTAMAVDYFPRLAIVANDRIKSRRTVNNQIEIILLIVVPIVIALIVSSPVVVRILLSKEFEETIPLLRWMGLGLLFKAFSFPMGYMSYAKGDKRTFFLLEGVCGNILTLAFNIGGYTLFGLQGLGVSFVASYLIYLITVILVTRYRYGFRLSMKTIGLLPISFALCTAAFLLFLRFDGWWVYGIGSGLLVLSVWYSFRELDKRIAIRELIRSKLGK